MGKEELAVAAPALQDMARQSSFAEVKTSSMPLFPMISCILCAPFSFIGGFYTQEPKTESVITHCGVVTEIVSTEGCHWSNPCYQNRRVISTAQNTFDLSRQEITDLHGNPMVVSAVLTYRFDDPKKALLNVKDVQGFVRQLATSVLKEVVGGYTYDELKTDGAQISREAIKTLQPRVATAGCKVVDITLNEVSYSSVIAGAMLRKQQAEQLLAARSLLVSGAVEIATKALDSLEETGSSLTPAERTKLASDLIVVSVSDKSE